MRGNLEVSSLQGYLNQNQPSMVSVNRWKSGRRASCCQIGKLGPDALDHRKDQFFYLVWLDLGFGQELCGAKPKLRHLGVGDFATGVDDQRERSQWRLLTEPLHEREAIAIGQGEVEYEQIGFPIDALPDGLLPR